MNQKDRFINKNLFRLTHESTLTRREHRRDWNTTSNMADCLDSLLDEVEAKFCREISLSHRPSCAVKAEQDKHKKQRDNDSVHRYISDLQSASASCHSVSTVLYVV